MVFYRQQWLLTAFRALSGGCNDKLHNMLNIISERSLMFYNNELGNIKCPTLVIGAGNDIVVGMKAPEEITEKIGNSRLIAFEGFGHGVYEEAKDFNKRVLEFLRA